MFNISFYLHTKKDRMGNRPIYCKYSSHSSRFRFSTGIKIHPDNWNSKREAPTHRYQNARLIENLLRKIRLELEEIAFSFLDQGMSSEPERVKEEWYKRRNQISVMKAWEEFEEVHLSSLAYNTQKRFNTTKGNLQAFNPAWEDFAEDWGEEFKKRLHFQGNSPDTASKKLADIKQFLRFAKKKGYLKTEHFLEWSTPPSKKKDKEYLTEEEVDLIRSVSLPSKRLSKARDIFLLLCLTGRRYSEAIAIEPRDILPDQKVSFLILKKKDKEVRVVLPVVKEAYEILERNRARLPFRVSNQKLNVYLKEVCQLAGVNSLVRDGKNEVEKWKKITSHTGRRTFITNSLNKGVPQHIVQRLVQHEDIKTTARYDQTGFEEMRRFVEELL